MLKLIQVSLLCIFIVSCGQSFDEAPKQADQALEELKNYYEEAKKMAPEDPVDWAKDDIQRYGDWEYRVVSIDASSNKEIEDQLNDYGKDRWEVFWVDDRDGALQVLLKRPAKSYLRSMPFSELGKAFSGDGAAE